jgi:hypothetical protein
MDASLPAMNSDELDEQTRIVTAHMEVLEAVSGAQAQYAEVSAVIPAAPNAKAARRDVVRFLGGRETQAAGAGDLPWCRLADDSRSQAQEDRDEAATYVRCGCRATGWLRRSAFGLSRRDGGRRACAGRGHRVGGRAPARVPPPRREPARCWGAGRARDRRLGHERVSVIRDVSMARPAAGATAAAALERFAPGREP